MKNIEMVASSVLFYNWCGSSRSKVIWSPDVEISLPPSLHDGGPTAIRP